MSNIHKGKEAEMRRAGPSFASPSLNDLDLSQAEKNGRHYHRLVTKNGINGKYSIISSFFIASWFTSTSPPASSPGSVSVSRPNTQTHVYQWQTGNRFSQCNWNKWRIFNFPFLKYFKCFPPLLPKPDSSPLRSIPLCMTLESPQAYVKNRSSKTWGKNY